MVFLLPSSGEEAVMFDQGGSVLLVSLFPAFPFPNISEHIPGECTPLVPVRVSQETNLYTGFVVPH